MKPNDAFIQQVLQLCRDMIILSDEGLAVARDDGCHLLCGIVQDCAYKIRLEAEREKEAHRQTVGRTMKSN